MQAAGGRPVRKYSVAGGCCMRVGIGCPMSHRPAQMQMRVAGWLRGSLIPEFELEKASEDAYRRRPSFFWLHALEKQIVLNSLLSEPEAAFRIAS